MDGTWEIGVKIIVDGSRNLGSIHGGLRFGLLYGKEIAFHHAAPETGGRRVMPGSGGLTRTCENSCGSAKISTATPAAASVRATRWAGLPSSRAA